MESISEPRARHRPIPLDRPLGDTEYVCRLLDGQAAEDSELDDLSLPRIERRQLIQDLIDEEQFVGTAVRIGQHVFNVQLRASRRAALRVRGARVVDENPAHRACGHGVEVRTALPVDRRPADDPQVDLADECRRLQRVARSLGVELLDCRTMQSLVDERHQLRFSLAIAAADPLKQLGDGCVVVQRDACPLTATFYSFRSRAAERVLSMAIVRFEMPFYTKFE
jgi:hypothetical protein